MSSKPVVCVGVPTLGHIHPESVASLLGVAAEITHYGHSLCYPIVDGVFPHSRARNEIMKYALEYSADFVWFIDSDMLVPAGAYSLMQKVMHEREDSDSVVIVTGHTPRRGYPYTNTWSKRMPVGPETGNLILCSVDADGQTPPQEIDSCGMACALLNMKWIRDNIKQPFFKQGEYMSDQGEGPGKVPENIWEDGFLCHQVRMLGGKIIGVPSVRCGHLSERVVINDESCQKLREEYIARQGMTTNL